MTPSNTVKPSAEGSWDGEWSAGTNGPTDQPDQPCTAGAVPLSARGIVADLFGTAFDRSPLNPGHTIW